MKRRSMKISRRELAVLGAVPLLAQSQPPVPASAPGLLTDFPASQTARLARDANQRNSEALTKFDVSLATEPAFLFRP